MVNQTEYLVFRSWSYRTKTPQVTFKLEKQINGDFQPFGEQKEAEINAIVEKVLGMNLKLLLKLFCFLKDNLMSSSKVKVLIDGRF
ncbi:hypothetical protein GTQ43_39200 [Nostoc sp. KVJ3]|uniref:hypothetical protein n=1 Tax=Nostoc sp. KVJ3 TaxID=457945 RepID=UPI002238FA44|nr:hypothetical protein [Nostoc sp. KVJ3]MCW5319382.1 hypothetical protein [Nostoc sp. KVJ3]